MTRSIRVATVMTAVLFASGAAAQGMLLDFAADKVIKKYEFSELRRAKGYERAAAVGKRKDGDRLPT